MNDLFQQEVVTISVSRVASDNNPGMKNFHYHNTYEIYYLVKGTRNYIIDEEYYSLVKGDLVLVKPGVLHKASGAAYDRIVVDFSRSYLDKFFSPEASSILLRCFDEKFVTIPFELRPKIIDLLEKISSLLEENREELTFIYLTELLNCISTIKQKQNIEEDNKPDDEKIIAKILHYINKNYAEIENISQIADNFFITKFYLCRIFKDATNTSVIEYLNRVKIKKACSLLETTDKTVLEICVICGFNSSVYFCKLFKKLMNTTPTQYRKNYQTRS